MRLRSLVKQWRSPAARLKGRACPGCSPKPRTAADCEVFPWQSVATEPPRSARPASLGGSLGLRRVQQYERVGRGYHSGSQAVEWSMLFGAMMLDTVAALRTAFYGAFQVLGDSCELAGWPTVQRFVADMFHSSAMQSQVCGEQVRDEADGRLRGCVSEAIARGEQTVMKLATIALLFMVSCAGQATQQRSSTTHATRPAGGARQGSTSDARAETPTKYGKSDCSCSACLDLSIAARSVGLSEADVRATVGSLNPAQGSHVVWTAAPWRGLDDGLAVLVYRSIRPGPDISKLEALLAYKIRS
jgi:hypothetical protein